MDFSAPLKVLLSSLILCGCLQGFHVRENLAEEQLLEPAIIRKPTGEKSWGVLPVYQDFLEGYIRGGLFDSNAHAIQGVQVNVQDEKGRSASEFSTGVSDNAGIYKIRFSLPIQWSRVDFTGILSTGDGWKINSPQTKFRLYFSRKNGVLAYSLKEVWLMVRNEQAQSKPSSLPTPPIPGQSEKRSGKDLSPAIPADKNKTEDLFGNFGFGP